METKNKSFFGNLCRLGLMVGLELSGIGQASAHGDHDAPKKVAGAHDYFVSESRSEKYELLLKYEPITAGKETVLRLFISNDKTNQPIEKAVLTLSSPENDKIKFIVTATTKAGIYEVKAIFPANKKYSITVSLTAGLGADLVLLQNIEVGKQLPKDEEPLVNKWTSNPFLIFGGGLAAGLLIMFIVMKLSRKRVSVPAVVLVILMLSVPVNTGLLQAHGDDKTGDISDAIEVPKETQFLFEILTQPLVTGNFTESTQLFATVVPASNGQALVQTPYNGKISSLSVNVGQVVKKGQLLAVIEQTVDAGTQINLLAERNNVEAELIAAKKEYERLQSIKDIAAKKDVSESEARYQRAVKNRQLFESVQGSSAGNTRFVPLMSPIDGILGNFTFAIGSTVTGGETLFTITNATKIYLEAQVFEKDAARIRAGVKFTAESPNDAKKTGTVLLLSTAPTINPSNQSQRVLFEMDNGEGIFKIGEFVNIRVFAQEAKRNLSVPNSAINEIDGKPVVFVKDAAEIFSVAYLTLGNNNGTSTEIIKGVEEGEKIVINATYSLKMMYLNQ